MVPFWASFFFLVFSPFFCMGTQKWVTTMEMRSHMGDPCAPPYWPHGPGDN